MIKTWASYNFNTGQYAICDEPIHFSEFLNEAGLKGAKCVNVAIATSKQALEDMLQVTDVSRFKQY